MHKFITLTILSLTLSAFANIKLGDSAMDSHEGSNNNIAIGAYTGSRLVHSGDNILVGNASGVFGRDISTSIGIGGGALSGAYNTKGLVAIGFNELAGVGYLEDTTSINRQQLFISRQANAFAINPMQESVITNTPLWYMNGILHFNCDDIEGLAGRGKPVDDYDFYLAPDGNDDNDGRSYKRPKKTFKGVWDAAQALDINTVTNLKCAVFAGTYYWEGTNSVGATVYGGAPMLNKRVHFVALDGPDKTCLSAPEDNFGRDAYELVSLSVSLFDTWSGYGGAREGADFVGTGGVVNTGVYRFQTLEGFTIKNFCGTFGKKWEYCAPTFTGFIFKDCVLTDNYFMHTGWGKSAALACRFYNCTITGNTWYNTAGGSTEKAYIFRQCEFYRTRVYDNAVETEGASGSIMMTICGQVLEDTFFSINLPMASNNFGGHDTYTARHVNSTIVCDGSAVMAAPVASTNCVLVADTWIASGSTNGVDMVRMDVDTFKTLHDLEYGLAKSIESDAVRMDGRKDAGCGDSGLALEKVVKARADIRVENGTLVVYQGGVVVGVIPMDAVATASMSAPVQMTSVAGNVVGSEDLTEDDDTLKVMTYPAN